MGISPRAQGAPEPLDVWQWRNPLPTGSHLNSVAFLNGQFVTAGSGPTLLTSTDGSNWVTHFVPGEQALTLGETAFGNGLYVLVGDQPGAGVILTSTNLDDWSFQPSGTANALQAVIYGNGLFVACGNGGTLLTSSDGTNWVPRASGTTGALKAIAYGNGLYVAVVGSEAFVSSDGVSWTPHTVGSDLLAVNYANGLFHAGGFGPGHLFVSTDASLWTAVALPPFANPIVAVSSSDSRYFAFSLTSILGSSDGTNFSVVPASNFVAVVPAREFLAVGPGRVAYGNGAFVAIGLESVFQTSSVLQTSADTTNWTAVTAGPFPMLTDIAWGNGVYVAVGSGYALAYGNESPYAGAIVVSSNGLPFVQVLSTTENESLSRVLFANGLFHCVGYHGTILRSTNGVQWVKRNSGVSGRLRSITYGNGLWVAVGDGGAVTTSPSGQAWTLRFAGTSYQLNGVACANNLFVAVGYLGTIITSPDGIQWTVQFSDTLETFFDIAYGGGQFVAVGADGVILTSPDGINWNRRVPGTTDDLHSVAAGKGVFVVAGFSSLYNNLNEDLSENLNGTLLTSTNGVDWTRRHPRTVLSLFGTRFLNDSFFRVGNGGAILQDASGACIQLAGRWNLGQGQFEVTIDGGLGQPFRLQSRESFGEGEWVERVALSSASSPVKFSDPTSSSHSQRFYRVVGQ